MKGRSQAWEKDWIGWGHRNLEDLGKRLIRRRAQHKPGKNQEVDWMVSMTACSLPRTKKIYGRLLGLSRQLLLEPACPLHPCGYIISLHPHKSYHTYALWNSFLATLQKSRFHWQQDYWDLFFFTRVGQVITIKAKVTRAFSTSMEVRGPFPYLCLLVLIMKLENAYHIIPT